MKFARPRKHLRLEYLSKDKQDAHDEERYGHWPNASPDEFGNNQRCRNCGAPPGKQCMKADSSFRDYPHQVRRNDARRWEGFGRNDSE